MIHSVALFVALNKVRGIEASLWGHSTVMVKLQSKVYTPNAAFNKFCALNKSMQNAIDLTNRVGKVNRNSCMIYKLGDNKTSERYVTARARTIVDASHSIAEYNRDGDAIKYVFEQLDFTKERLIFVLSDGAPSAYKSRNNGIDATREVVNSLREKGAHVHSFSLVNGVVLSNNEIYGKKYNHDLTNIAALSDIAKQIMLDI